MRNQIGWKLVSFKESKDCLNTRFNSVLTGILEKSSKFVTSCSSNVFLCYYFQLKRIEQISFVKYFNLDIPIEKDENLDSSIKSMTALIKSLSDNFEIEFHNPLFEIYFSALYIIKELSNDKEPAQERTRSLILKYRYYKKYSQIWQFIANLLSHENVYFKSLNLNQDKLLIDYWKIILSCSNKDLIGIYHNSFLEKCLDCSNLDNQFFKIAKKNKQKINFAIQISNDEQMNDQLNEPNGFNDLNNGIKNIMQFIQINGYEKKPIFIREFNQLSNSLFRFRSTSDNQKLLEFYQYCLENETSSILLSSSLVKENILVLIKKLAINDSSTRVQCCILFEKILKNHNGFRTKFISAKSLAIVKKELDATILNVLIEGYLSRNDCWHHVPDLIRNSSISNVNLIDKIFSCIITQTKQEDLCQAFFSLLANSTKYRKEILNFKLDLENLSSNFLKSHYYDLHFNLASFIYLNELIDLIFAENNNLIFKLDKYILKSNSKFDLKSKISLLYNQDNFVSKLDYFIQHRLLVSLQSIPSLINHISLKEIDKFINLLIKYDQLDSNLNIVINHLSHLIINEDIKDCLVDHVIPSLRLIFNQKKLNQLSIDLIKVIIEKFIQNSRVFKSINILLIQMARHVEPINEPGKFCFNLETFFELLFFYYTEFQKYQKCFIKKKNLNRLKANSEEMNYTIDQILNFLDSIEFLEMVLEKYKQTNSNDYLRFFVKKCIVNKLSIVIEQNQLLVFDNDVISNQIVFFF